MTATIMTATINGGQFVTGGAPLNGSTRFSQLIGFGDSSIDTGYFFTHPYSTTNPDIQKLYNAAVAAGGGLPTDPKNLMNTTLIAAAFGTTAIPVGQTGGTNYAVSGATDTGLGFLPGPSIVEQIDNYLTEHAQSADRSALYYFSTGGNSYNRVLQTSANFADQQAKMISEAHAMSAAMIKLSAAGAQHFVLRSYGGDPLFASYNATLWSDLDAAHVAFTVADRGSLGPVILANPSAFGLTNVVRPPNGPYTPQNPYNPANGGSTLNPGVGGGWSLLATQSVSATAPDTYLYADYNHLAAAGQRIAAANVANVIANAVPVVSEVLRATPLVAGQGTVAASELSYQWQREVDGQSTWTNITGATQVNYTVSSADVGSHLRVLTTYTTRAGGESASAISPATPTVIASAPQAAHLSFYDTPVSNTVSGAASLDAVNYFGVATKFTVSVATDKTVTITGPNTGTDKLTSVERIQFADGILALDTARNEDNAGSAYRMYQAAFNRTPDKGGVSFWTSVLDRGNSLDVVAQGFVKADEFKGVYGTNPTNARVVDLFYQNVLGRPGEEGGRNFWIGTLDAGASVATVLKGFANSPENHARVDPVIAGGISLDTQAFLV